MTTPESDEDLGDELVPEEWPTFFTMVPTWLLLCGCSAQAYRMYAFLAEHIAQRTPGQRIACPKQVAIARVLGLKDDRQAARYRQELESLGAIRVEEYRYHGGMRRGYRYFVRFNPPSGFEGLTSLAAFYEANPDVRSAKSEGRMATAKTSAPKVPAQSGPMDGYGAAPAPAPNPAKKPAKADRNGRQAPLAPEVQQILSAFPPALRAAMRETAHTDAPKTLVTAVLKELQERSAEQLVSRVLRRWQTHGYEAKFTTGELARPVGAAVAMLRHGHCPDPNCEDGALLTGGPCRACEMRSRDHRADRAAERRAAQAAQRAETCPACEEDRGTGGLICEPCADGYAQSIAEAADRAAAEVAATPGRSAQDAAQAHTSALAAADAARVLARRDGATDLGQWGQAVLAAQEAVAVAHRARLGSLPESASTEAPSAQHPVDAPLAACGGTRADGSPCHRTTDAPDGLCSPCRAVRGLQQTEALATAF